MKNIVNKVAAFSALVMASAPAAFAQATPLYELPDTGDVKATIVGLAGGLAIILLVMLGIRKGTKTMNRT